MILVHSCKTKKVFLAEYIILLTLSLFHLVTCSLITKFLYIDQRKVDHPNEAPGTKTMWNLGSFHFIFLWMSELFIIITVIMYSVVVRRINQFQT